MGDRANIFVVDRPKVAEDDTEASGIYLYTHWEGYNWPEKLRQALRLETAKRRWRDEPYLLRIIVDHLFADLRGAETGGGISTMMGDNSYPITVLDLVNRTVSWATPGLETDRDCWKGTLPFEEFINLAHADYLAELS